MNDYISRQAAIDTLKSQLSDWNDDYNIPVRKSIENIERLPSAQPEIIRCKDCLMHGVCRFEQGLGLDGYCSQAERREE